MCKAYATGAYLIKIAFLFKHSQNRVIPYILLQLDTHGIFGNEDTLRFSSTYMYVQSPCGQYTVTSTGILNECETKRPNNM